MELSFPGRKRRTHCSRAFSEFFGVEFRAASQHLIAVREGNEKDVMYVR